MEMVTGFFPRDSHNVIIKVKNIYRRRQVSQVRIGGAGGRRIEC